MRLSTKEITVIKDIAKKIFYTEDIFLFGSRVNDNIKGGDIDLFVIPKTKDALLEKKIEFLVELKEKIGDQKIDLIVSRDTSRLIEQEALLKGIKL